MRPVDPAPKRTRTWLIVTFPATPAIVVAGRPSVADYPVASRFGPRTLRDFELVWVLRGTATWTLHDAPDTRPQTVSLVPGTLLLARPGMHDAFHWDERVPTRHAYVHFDLDPVPDGTSAWPVIRHADERGPLAALLRYLLWLTSSPDLAAYDRTDDVLALVLSLFTEGPLPGPGSAPPLPPPLTAALAHVRTAWRHHLRPVTLAELAAAGSVSTGYLNRLFHTHFGTSPVRALELVRLDRATVLLTRTDLPISSIARSCGYPDPLHFSRRFRHALGRSPRAFRASHSPTAPIRGGTPLAVLTTFVLE
jgi:AraC-like DNA-binding protein